MIPMSPRCYWFIGHSGQFCGPCHFLLLAKAASDLMKYVDATSSHSLHSGEWNLWASLHFKHRVQRQYIVLKGGRKKKRNNKNGTTAMFWIPTGSEFFSPVTNGLESRPSSDTQDDPEQLSTAPECVCGDNTAPVVAGGGGRPSDNTTARGKYCSSRQELWILDQKNKNPNVAFKIPREGLNTLIT